MMCARNITLIGPGFPCGLEMLYARNIAFMGPEFTSGQYGVLGIFAGRMTRPADRVRKFLETSWVDSDSVRRCSKCDGSGRIRSGVFQISRAGSGHGSGRIGSGSFQISRVESGRARSRVGSDRVRKFSTLPGRVGSGQDESDRVRTGRVGSGHPDPI